jgi:hypothetical protein
MLACHFYIEEEEKEDMVGMGSEVGGAAITGGVAGL